MTTASVHQVTFPPLTLTPHRFTVDEYHYMIAAGVFGEDDSIELVEGWIIDKMPRNPPHDAVTGMIGSALRQGLPQGWCVRTQSAITTATSEPEPDQAVVSGGDRDYLTKHPHPGEIGLVVEVASSSLETDRSLKMRAYASAGIPHYWIANLIDSQLEVHSEPSTSGYAKVEILRSHDVVPLIIGGQEVARLDVRSLLP